MRRTVGTLLSACALVVLTAAPSVAGPPVPGLSAVATISPAGPAGGCLVKLTVTYNGRKAPIDRLDANPVGAIGSFHPLGASVVFRAASKTKWSSDWDLGPGRDLYFVVGASLNNAPVGDAVTSNTVSCL